jgi:hypothetical protein
LMLESPQGAGNLPSEINQDGETGFAVSHDILSLSFIGTPCCCLSRKPIISDGYLWSSTFMQISCLYSVYCIHFCKSLCFFEAWE